METLNPTPWELFHTLPPPNRANEAFAEPTVSAAPATAQPRAPKRKRKTTQKARTKSPGDLPATFTNPFNGGVSPARSAGLATVVGLVRAYLTSVDRKRPGLNCVARRLVCAMSGADAEPEGAHWLEYMVGVFILVYVHGHTRESLLKTSGKPGRNGKGVTHSGDVVKFLGLPGGRRTLRRHLYRAHGFTSRGRSSLETWDFGACDFAKAKSRCLFFGGRPDTCYYCSQELDSARQAARHEEKDCALSPWAPRV